MTCRTLFAAGLALLGSAWAYPADDPETAKVMAKYKHNIDRGLQWLARQQYRDGHWEATNGRYPIAMTALAGMALLAEGSTPHQGKYAKHIDDAVEYLVSRCQKNGLIGNPLDPEERQRYMYGEETDPRRREELKQILQRAVEFTIRAQTRLGGWGYVSAADGSDFDEGSVTITQVQALRAARNAGIPVPKDAIDRAHEYLKKSTVLAPGGDHTDPKKRIAGVIYSLQRAGDRRVRGPLTAAGVACMFNAGEYDSEMAIQWLNYCQKYLPTDKVNTIEHWEYTNYYYAQVLYTLGEDRHAQLRPDLAEIEQNDPNQKVLLKWSRYREVTFEHICAQQNADGSWTGRGGFSNVGPVYVTSVFLTILQLDKANLPIYQR
jgi:hypothetical protein